MLNRLRHTPWLGTALRVLVLCFALGTLAHAGHTHDLHSSADTHYNCDYCTSYGGLIDAPVQPVVATDPPTPPAIIATRSRVVVTQLVGLPQARAPPAH